MTHEQLIELAKEILDYNPEAALSGSLAIILQKGRLKRDIGDLDIYLPFGVSPVMPSSAVNITDSEEHYDDEENTSVFYRYKDVKINFLSPEIESSNIRESLFIKKEGIRMVRIDEIVRFKLQFCFDRASTWFKHREDILFMIAAMR